MEPVTTPAAPAPPVTPTISATRDFANKGDFAAFDDAHLAARSGAPRPKVTEPAIAETTEAIAEIDPAAPAQPARELSKRQQDINERVQQAAERATTTLREENARLKAELAARTAPRESAPAAPAPPATAQTLEQAIKAPNTALPMLVETEFFEKYPEATYSAYTRYAVQYDLAADRAAERQQAERQTSDAEHQEVVQSFDARVNALAKDDPDIIAKLVPIADALGRAKGPSQVVSDLVIHSELGPQVLLHFKDHPDALTKLTTLPVSMRQLSDARKMAAHRTFILKEFGKLEASLESAAPPATAAVAAQPSTITAAPPPPETVSRAGSTKDPQKAAFERGDFAEWDRIETHKKQRKGAA